jgi:hypothetical protein
MVRRLVRAFFLVPKPYQRPPRERPKLAAPFRMKTENGRAADLRCKRLASHGNQNLEKIQEPNMNETAAASGGLPRGVVLTRSGTGFTCRRLTQTHRRVALRVA